MSFPVVEQFPRSRLLEHEQSRFGKNRESSGRPFAVAPGLRRSFLGSPVLLRWTFGTTRQGTLLSQSQTWNIGGCADDFFRSLCTFRTAPICRTTSISDCGCALC